MTETRPLACARHLAVVERSWAPDATLEDLDAYASEAADCPDCGAALSLRLAAHPEVLRRGGSAPPSEGWRQVQLSLAGSDVGMRALAAVVARRPGRSAVPPVAWAVLTAVAAAAVAVGFYGFHRLEAPAGVVSVAQGHAAPAPDDDAADRDSPSMPLRHPVAREPVAPKVVERAHPPARGESQEAEPAPVAVAALDWPNPPFEDLVGATPKSAEPAGRVLRLEVDVPEARVGDRLPLSVGSSRIESVAVCVDGPESGMIWRGAVPSGTTTLSSGGRPVAFRFERPGRYDLWTSRDVATCRDPVDVVEVEVAP
jgi:hypothetical protein